MFDSLHPTRRGFLTAALAGSASLIIPRTLSVLNTRASFAGEPEGVGVRPSIAPARVRPSEALRLLQEGNSRLIRGEITGPNRGLDRLAAVAPSQAPFAAILGCADSRVPPELLFDQGFGDLFVVRVAGNVVTSEALASLEFAVAALGASFVLVLGHTACGAVEAAMSTAVPPGQISTLFRHIAPAIPSGVRDTDEAVAVNAEHQLRVLHRGSPLLAGLLREGRVGFGAGVYHLDSGQVDVIHALGV